MRKDRFFKQDGKMIFHKYTDAQSSLDAVKLAREVPIAPVSDSWHVGRIDAHVLESWIKEAGVAYHDKPAVMEVIRKKLLDGDNAAWRVKEGTF